MRPLERSPGVDPGFPDCAARACPLHAARVYDYAVSLCSVIPGQCARCRGNPPVERKLVGEGGLEPPFWG